MRDDFVDSDAVRLDYGGQVLQTEDTDPVSLDSSAVGPPELEVVSWLGNIVLSH